MSEVFVLSVLEDPLAPVGWERFGGKQFAQAAAVSQVGVGDKADGDVVAWALDDLDWVAGRDVARFDDREVCARTAGAGEAAGELRVVHAYAELEARKARLSYLEDGRADGPAFADAGVGDVEAKNRAADSYGADCAHVD
jgi:hypothetical protein